MSLFKKMVQQDIQRVFLNPGEFAQQVVFDGQPLTAIVDDGRALYQGQAADGFADAAGLGLLQGDRALLCSADELSEPPHPGQRVVVDGTVWLVAAVNDEDGLFRIVLNRAYA